MRYFDKRIQLGTLDSADRNAVGDQDSKLGSSGFSLYCRRNSAAPNLSNLIC